MVLVWVVFVLVSCFVFFFETVLWNCFLRVLWVESVFQRPGVWNIVCKFLIRRILYCFVLCFRVRFSYMHVSTLLSASLLGSLVLDGLFWMESETW